MKVASTVGQVLLVDDDEKFARLMADMGRQAGCRVHHAASLDAAREVLAQGRRFDLLLIDLRLPDGDGIALVESIDLVGQGRVAIVTGMPSVDTAARVVDSPVVDYLVKPVPAETLRKLLLDAHAAASDREARTRPFGNMVGASAPMRALFARIRQVAPMDVSVLIHGESGTGKELVARALHDESSRDGRFVAVNCGAIAHELLGSHLFGHERGAFTGASQPHAGYFEQAEGGTLFLDEITEMPLRLQVYLLRVLESRTLTRLGGTREIATDVRVVAATNCDVHAAVKSGLLREDLYYRLTEFPLQVLPLRERREDIPLLARHFLDQLNHEYGTRKSFRPEAMLRMTEAPWRGNVRELRHAVQRQYILSGEGEQLGFAPDGAANTTLGDDGSVRFSVGMTFDEVEREMLLKTLARCGNNKRRTASALGITAKTIYNRLMRYRAAGLIEGNSAGGSVPKASCHD